VCKGGPGHLALEQGQLASDSPIKAPAGGQPEPVKDPAEV
jgi:hypothetical protein